MTTKPNPAFAEEFDKLYKDREGALFQVEELTRQKNEHADNARLKAAEADQLRQELEEERAAHAATRSKVSALQERASQVPELERRLAKAESDLGNAKHDVEVLRERLKSAKEKWLASESARRVAEAAADKAERERAKYDTIKKALAARRAADEVIAAELGG